ncbi:MAG: 30S ribosomal protein S17 [Rickettsiaceae bacterium]|nr:30S ribosomal protein S17 [Rickettsiaceae bacterium]
MPKRILTGIVVSTKAQKTALVKVERRFAHKKYHKTVTVSKKYAVHDEDSSCKEGQKVRIIECRPISRTKKWQVLKESAE